ncbi:tripartite tricarboxylate transporter permease [Acetomicrobium sp. S15 = DSM 107314]|jgi:putative tricarboxylic transport membrane protein|uniref:tripartite tricarboxylate transporter permease n=1 Tax=Acetomicrobium sp. S15 = DSM 107314 TaxID=2529858 RepID=UPI0018E0DD21|nr:tripartite tricarboxylate transporter permease [Acetomicrobium sp. S15 = DSM 107314]
MDGLSIVFQEITRLFTQPFMLFTMAWATFLGIVVGALPGLTATMTIALLSGLTYGVDPRVAIPILISVYCGAIYGGSQSAILVNIPGTPSAAATTLDGYPLARKGEAGPAIGLATTASFIGGVLGVLAVAVATPLLAQVALKFGSWEYFLLAVFGIVISGNLTAEDLPIKGWISGFIGLLLSMVGLEGIHAFPRFSYGNVQLAAGISLIPALIGLFGIAEVLAVLKDIKPRRVESQLNRIVPKIGEVLSHWKTTFKAALVGIGIGLIPGVGEDVAAWVSYDVCKRTSPEKEKYGTGCYEGLVAAETANNACIGGAIIPMLALGIPGSGAAAVLLGGIWLHGIRPGPMIFFEFPTFTYELIGQLIVANVMMLILGLTLTRFTVRVLEIKKEIFMPLVVVLCVIGGYAVNMRIFDVYLMLGFGLLGYALRIGKFPAAPMTLGIILGPMADENFRRALSIADGSLTPFFTRPISLGLVILIVLLMLSQNKKLMAKIFRRGVSA